jgi:UDP-GlcNAc:undecaprenyl-phosphate GlcNAc-1-phosphate transferase
MFAVGLLDDFRPLGARLKLLGQVVIASVVCLGGIEVDAVTNPITHTTLELGAFSFFVTVFWLVAMTNLINLIDGIDGLAGGIAFMLMCLLAYAGVGHMDFYFLVAVVMAGALLGFIYYNFPPAKFIWATAGLISSAFSSAC